MKKWVVVILDNKVRIEIVEAETEFLAALEAYFPEKEDGDFLHGLKALKDYVWFKNEFIEVKEIK